MTEKNVVTTSDSAAEAALEEGEGVLRMMPTWVPRSFCVPGRRLRLHPDDYFAYGGERGGIDERWLSSSTRADNGPATGEYEGVSLVLGTDGRHIPFDTVVDNLGGTLIGARLWNRDGGWTVYSKFFDNAGPLPFHVHHDDEAAARVGRRGKPEAYYFPPELNNHLGLTPVSYFGLRPGTTRQELADRLRTFSTVGDNRVTELSQAYRIELGTGWDIPPGVLHAPASVLTYEPQAASDVFAMCECWTSSRTISADLLWKDVPPAERGNVDYIIDLLDWDRNTDPFFAQNRFMRPLPASEGDGYREEWIVYRSSAFSAKRLVVQPGRSVVVTDPAAYGAIAIAGRGRFGVWPLETPTVVRFGAPTQDEFFVSESAALTGVRIANESETQPLVILKHFGPENPDNAMNVDPA
ncbi:hypothetical protein [Phytohabitans kaempferiae]|uniref:Mannose-6-phosphate isomerase n=1 Tax=Phytohabitans kaempferiae TaxID=1620943 RepID=A0ABV6MB29_9ACTN